MAADPNYLMANERMNLMNMAKLSIKGLIESALNLGRTLDSDYAPLQQFFVVMEHCLKHGLKGRPWLQVQVCMWLFPSSTCSGRAAFSVEPKSTKLELIILIYWNAAYAGHRDMVDLQDT